MPLLRGTLKAAEAIGLDMGEVVAALDLDPDHLDDSDRRVPRTVLYRLWELMVAATGDDALGLHVAAATQPGAFAVLDYAMRNAPTLGDAYRQMARYSHVLHDGVDIVLEVDRDSAWIRYREPAGSPRQIAEWIVATWLVVGRQISGEDWAPELVAFQHRAPETTAEHRALFRSPVDFDGGHNELRFAAALLERPAEAADPMLFSVVSRYADSLLTALPTVETTADAVRQVVAELLRGGDPTLKSVARRLDVAPRTLQRRLRAEGASFQGVLDDVRCALAKQYLGDAAIAIEETAFLLGFSEPSAFNRAFKRWTGATPSEFRT